MPASHLSASGSSAPTSAIGGGGGQQPRRRTAASFAGRSSKSNARHHGGSSNHPPIGNESMPMAAKYTPEEWLKELDNSAIDPDDTGDADGAVAGTSMVVVGGADGPDLVRNSGRGAKSRSNGAVPSGGGDRNGSMVDRTDNNGKPRGNSSAKKKAPAVPDHQPYPPIAVAESRSQYEERRATFRSPKSEQPVGEEKSCHRCCSVM